MAENKTIVKDKDKAGLIEAARLAESNPVASAFWSEVAEHLDRVEAKPEVKPRLTGDSQ